MSYLCNSVITRGGRLFNFTETIRCLQPLTSPQVRNYALRKGTRERKRAAIKKVKVEEVKTGFVPKVKSKDLLLLNRIKRRFDDPGLKTPVDNVYTYKYYQWTEYTFAEAIRQSRETHHPEIYNVPNAPVNVSIHLDMEGEKKTKVFDNFHRMAPMPHGFDHGEQRSVLAFAKSPEQQQAARDAGAALSGGGDLIRSVQSGDVALHEFQFVVADPLILPELLPLRGLLKKKFPNPKSGTLEPDVGSTVKRFIDGMSYSALRDQYEVDFGVIETTIGTLNMDVKHLENNFISLIEDVNKAKPKRPGRFIIRCIVSSPPSKEKFKIKHNIYLKDSEDHKKREHEEEEIDNTGIIEEENKFGYTPDIVNDNTLSGSFIENNHELQFPSKAQIHSNDSKITINIDDNVLILDDIPKNSEIIDKEVKHALVNSIEKESDNMNKITTELSGHEKFKEWFGVLENKNEEQLRTIENSYTDIITNVTSDIEKNNHISTESKTDLIDNNVKDTLRNEDFIDSNVIHPIIAEHINKKSDLLAIEDTVNNISSNSDLSNDNIDDNKSTDMKTDNIDSNYIINVKNIIDEDIIISVPNNDNLLNTNKNLDSTKTAIEIPEDDVTLEENTIDILKLENLLLSKNDATLVDYAYKKSESDSTKESTNIMNNTNKKPNQEDLNRNTYSEKVLSNALHSFPLPNTFVNDMEESIKDRQLYHSRKPISRGGYKRSPLEVEVTELKVRLLNTKIEQKTKLYKIKENILSQKLKIGEVEFKIKEKQLENLQKKLKKRDD